MQEKQDTKRTHYVCTMQPNSSYNLKGLQKRHLCACKRTALLSKPSEKKVLPSYRHFFELCNYNFRVWRIFISVYGAFLLPGLARIHFNLCTLNWSIKVLLSKLIKWIKITKICSCFPNCFSLQTKRLINEISG